MIGIFDSGIGGITALSELRQIAPSIDIIYLADRNNAPYGTKTECELVSLSKKSIKRLRNEGACRVLIACCTASTVYPLLDLSERRISTPIISPAAKKAAELTKNGKIAVMATRRTAASHAFTNEITKIRSDLKVFEWEAQELVALVEGGARDGQIKDAERKRLEELTEPARLSGADTLILGCTHFPHLERTISEILPGIRLVSPSREGAESIAPFIEKGGMGRTVYL